MSEELLLDEEHENKEDYSISSSTRNLLLISVLVMALTFSWQVSNVLLHLNANVIDGRNAANLFASALLGLSVAYTFYYRVLVYKHFELKQLSLVVKIGMYLAIFEQATSILLQFTYYIGIPTSLINFVQFALVIAELVMVVRVKSNDVDRHFKWLKRFNWAVLGGLILIVLASAIYFVSAIPDTYGDTGNLMDMYMKFIAVTSIIGTIGPLYFLVKHAISVPKFD